MTRARTVGDGLRSLAGWDATGQRSDIQGLRALAVTAVILNHLVGWPAGGFVGVDVFFVISGFLITGHLLREHDTEGRISFAAFYARRVKRILPMALVVLAVTVAVSFVVFNEVRSRGVLVDAVWALLFSANWQLVAEGADYFAATSAPSPLEHYWSLGVEEQFYLVWPAIMVAAIAILGARLRGDGPRRAAALAIGAITVASLAWALGQSAANPASAYFSTLTRVWELGVGALLACATPLLLRLPGAMRPLLAWSGLAGILASGALIDGRTTFPAPWGLLPVLGTALVIAAGTGRVSRTLVPLTNAASRYVGDISYSLYLWHLPVIVLGSSLFPDGGRRSLLGFALVTFALAVVGYHLIENPIRRSRWLVGGTPRRAAAPRGVLARRAVSVAAVSAMAFGAGAVLVVTDPHAASVHSTPPTRDVPAASELGPANVALEREILDAVGATAWPELDPPMREVIGNTGEPVGGVNACGSLVDPAPDECAWGDGSAPRTAVLLGDSVALAWMPALMPMYATGDWRLLVRANHGCAFVASKPDTPDSCDRHKEEMIDLVAELEPDLVIVANNYPVAGDLDVWGADLSATLSRLNGFGQLLVLAPPPQEKSIEECYLPAGDPSDCVTASAGYYQDLEAAERRATEGAGGTYVETEWLFCTADGECPAFVGTVPVKIDTVHMSRWYAAKIEPALRELLGAVMP
ncbi:acyltransferase family protein [Salinibacterium soli]|uniref:Acyltransferase family protein n=1 Tax=Antiquaquibacter soli TaxID=3064523 RepID=A0ABT9BJ44_9MICO|nr:acyltransferase family protein [Protaetiibacter sp. WY-16]MDO7881038.1 acyltransferase family protein [Protaetiibacter sp. WY-16]